MMASGIGGDCMPGVKEKGVEMNNRRILCIMICSMHMLCR